MNTAVFRNSTRSSSTHSPRRILALVAAIVFATPVFFLPAHAVTRTDLRQYEEEWTKAQQQYYDELKKLKSPRKSEEVKALKESILTPKKKALQDAYRKFDTPKAKPKGNIPDTEGDTSTAGGENQRKAAPEPIVILDGTGVKKEVRYLKKGAPQDMTEEESPDFEGPKVLSSPGVDTSGEIAYPAKKKPAQGLKNKAP